MIYSALQAVYRSALATRMIPPPTIIGATLNAIQEARRACAASTEKAMTTTNTTGIAFMSHNHFAARDQGPVTKRSRFSGTMSAQH